MPDLRPKSVFLILLDATQVLLLYAIATRCHGGASLSTSFSGVQQGEIYRLKKGEKAPRLPGTFVQDYRITSKASIFPRAVSFSRELPAFTGPIVLAKAI